MLRFEIRPTISRLLLVIIAIGVRHLFLSSRVSNFPWIDVTISELRLEVTDRDKLFGSVLEAAEAAALQLIQLTGRPLWRFALLCVIQSFIDVFLQKLVTKLQWRTSLIIFNSCQQLDATFPQNSNSLRHISTISDVVPMD
jgi:hypothetical protein